MQAYLQNNLSGKIAIKLKSPQNQNWQGSQIKGPGKRMEMSV